MIDIELIKQGKVNFEDMGIFELRELARAVGVHLPTTLRKQQLIEEINAVTSGAKERFVPSNKKGRPPKGYINKISTTPILAESTSTIEGNRIYDYEDWGKFEGEYMVMPRDIAYHLTENDSSELSDKFYAMQEIVTGVIHMDKQMNARLHIGKRHEIGEHRIAKIAPRCIQKYNLRSGDYVEGVVGISMRDNSLTLFRVYKICDRDVKTPRSNYEEQKLLPITQQIHLNDELLNFTEYLCPIGKGQRVLIVANDEVTRCNLMRRMANAISKQMHTFYVVIDNSPECIPDEETNNLDYVSCPLSLTRHKQLYIVELIMEAALRMLEYGDDVTIFVENIELLYDMYSRYYSKYYHTQYEINERAQMQLKNNISIGRNIGKGSITFIAGVANPNNNQQDYINESKRAFNTLINVKSFSDYTPIILDVNNTYSTNAEKILKEDYAISMRLRAECIDQDNDTINAIIKKYSAQ